MAGAELPRIAPSRKRRSISALEGGPKRPIYGLIVPLSHPYACVCDSRLLNRPSFKLQPEGVKVGTWTAEVADNVSIGRPTYIIESRMSDVLQRSHLAGPPSIGKLKGGVRGHKRAVHLSRTDRDFLDAHFELCICARCIPRRGICGCAPRGKAGGL